MNKRSAFTLIEVLIALFIFAILATIATQVLHHSILVKEELQKKQTQLIKHQAIISRLKSDINHTVDYAGFEHKNTSFSGSAHALKFYKISDELGGDALIPVVQAIQLSIKDHQLIETIDNKKATVIANNISQFSLAYIDCQGSKKQTWSLSHNDTNQRDLPCVVSLTMRIDNTTFDVAIPIKGGNID